MAKSNEIHKAHPFKRILRAYGITNGMLAAHLKVGKQRISNMLNGQSMMPMSAEWKLQKLVNRLQNPVFEDTEAASEPVT